MLSILHLTKRFGSLTAVNDLNMEIRPGELFGFVGHNGAGKTTTMKIISGLLAPDAGEIRIHGEAVADARRLAGQIGYMPDFFGVYDNLKTIEYLEFYASLYGMTGRTVRRRSREILDLIQMADRSEQYVDTLSRGLKQRLCLGRSILHDPEILLLDEPASGLDPRARHEMKELVRNLNAEGKTILISSHILPELADMCTSIGIMQEGRLLMQGTMEEIELQAMYTRPLHIRTLSPADAVLKSVQADPCCRKAQAKGQEILADYSGTEEDASSLLSRLIAEGARIDAFYREKGSLESLFMELTSEEGLKLYEEEQGGDEE